MPEFFRVLTPTAAWGRLAEHYRPISRPESVSTFDALDRVLAVAVFAPHDLPQFARSTVDGYAVRAQDAFGASSSLPAFLDVVGEADMGRAATQAVARGQAILVHTGGMIPPGADAVVMIENTQKADERSIEVLAAPAVGENIIQVGEDVGEGEMILPAGHRLRPQDIGGLLALGITMASVARPPRVAILSTGDEVIPPDQTPGPGQVRDINSYTLKALTQRAGGEPVLFGIVPDQRPALQAAVRQAVATCDIVVLSAGSSVSYRDMSVDVIAGLGEPGILAHGISIRPGKPTIVAVAEGKAVFGLPGNPVSAMVLFDLFVAPAIRLALGAEPFSGFEPQLQARLARQISSAAGREDHIQVRLEEREGELWAVPVFGKSNLIYTLVRADGVVRVHLDSLGVEQGVWVTATLHE
ncbi:MAG: molybdopterin molybdotransferase MoeA [Caldilineales bacterium]|nr:molybdopterin molybdotransferase MoeA [Caldilineales bacterium]MCW5857397.1 molybdopterin molybdotransferase MoeA [Caldilineales bacterium]